MPSVLGSTREDTPRGDGAWYADETTLLSELRATLPGATAVLPGLTDMVELRRGGQGVVLAATQVSTNRRVAVKVLLSGEFASPGARARFAREVELSAAVRHPGVVRVYDSGVTPSGAPYLVMELVEGPTLDEYCRAHSLRERLAVMADVCAAVQAAHLRGVVHRDLKPSNIRVDDAGRPRVLDFGIARAVQGAAARTQTVTEPGQFVGSLAWASPEQVAGDESAVDARSDIYSLGVLLYFIASGRMPYDTSGSLRSAVEQITTATPRPLHLPEGGADLDAVVAAALAKDPEQRYQSAGDLERDLRAVLAGEPILARRDGAWRALRRRARRYRIALAVGSVTLAVVGGLLITTWAALGDASAARATAERHAAQQQRVNEFLTEVLSAPNPGVEGREVRVADVLRRKGATIDAAFGNDPAQAAALHETVGQSFQALGLTEEAAQHYEAQARWAAHVDGPEGPESLRALARRASILRAQSKLTDAEAAARRVHGARVRALGPDHTETLEAANLLAAILIDLERLPEAERLVRESLDARVRTRGEGSKEAVESMAALASILRKQDKLAEAAEVLARAVPAAERAFGPDDPTTLVIAGNRANALSNLGRYAEAEPVLRSVLARQRVKLGDDHPHTLGTLSNLATCVQNQGRLDEAEAMFRECVQRSGASAGPGAVRTIIYKNNLAKLLIDRDRKPEAAAILDGALRDAEATLGPDHSVTQAVRGNVEKTR